MSSEIGCVWGLGLGLIHSDRVVCQMWFSAEYTDWSSLGKYCGSASLEEELISSVV